MRASIVIASLNEGDRLWKTVASCRETLGTLDAEIIVADDGSHDGSLDELRRRFPQVPIFVQPERVGVSPTKDLGARHANGEVLLFLDGHCKPEAEALARLVTDVERLEGQAVVMPRIPVLNVETWQSNFGQVGHGFQIDLEQFGCGFVGLERLRRHPSPQETTFYESPALIGCCFAVSRKLYERLGGFDTDMRIYGVEDLDFGLKSWLMGHPILVDPAAAIGHRFQAGFTSYAVPMEHLLANQLRMARKNFTESVWQEWVERWRSRNPAALCEAAWTLFEARRASVERERDYLFAHRVHDEYWYAERFHLAWPIRPQKVEDTADDPLIVEEAWERYLDHYRNPRNRRILPEAQAVGRVEWSGGAALTFYLQLVQGSEGSPVIACATFQSQRCGIGAAYASLLSEWLLGRTVAEAWQIGPAELMQQFGPRAGALDAAGKAISALRQALAHIPEAVLPTC